MEVTPAATTLTLSVRDVPPGLSAEILVRVTSENYADFIVVLTLSVGEGSTDVKGENMRENTQVGFRRQVLFVNTPFDEKISVYSLRGSLLFSSRKPAGEAAFPTGERVNETVVIVTGGTGWTRKVLVNGGTVSG
jgi:hypothetical protein